MTDTTTGPTNGPPGLFDAVSPRPVEQRAAPAAPRPAPLLYFNADTGDLLVSLDEARNWALIEAVDGATTATELDVPPGGLEWCLAELSFGYRPPHRP